MSRRLLSLLMLPVLAGGCGHAAATTPTRPAAPTQSASAPATAGADVLGLGDLGLGWLHDGLPAPVSLLSTMKDDSAATRRVERHSYRAGYKATFITGHGQAVESNAFVYSTPQDARTVAAAWVGTASTAFRGATRIDNSGSGLGDDTALWRTTGTSHGHRFPMYIAQWVRGNVIAGLVLAGNGSTAGQLLRLAHLQDARVMGHPSGSRLTGEAAKSAAQVLTDVQAAVSAASSVHSFEAAGGQILDFHAGPHSGEGTITQGAKVQQVRRIGRNIWVNANAAYYEQVSAATAARFAGRWLFIPKSTPGYVGPEQLTSTHLTLGMVTPGTGGGTTTLLLLGTTRLHGQLVILIHIQNTGGVDNTVYVPASGAALPVQVDQTEDGRVDHVILDDWNQPLNVLRPAHPVTACSCS